METEFKLKDSGITIHAPLGGSLIHATMRSCDLAPAFLEAIKETPEHARIMKSINNEDSDLRVITDPEVTNTDERWETEEMSFFIIELFDILNAYAPEGYYFGSHPGDGSDYGYWPAELLD